LDTSCSIPEAALEEREFALGTVNILASPVSTTGLMKVSLSASADGQLTESLLPFGQLERSAISRVLAHRHHVELAASRSSKYSFTPCRKDDNSHRFTEHVCAHMSTQAMPAMAKNCLPRRAPPESDSVSTLDTARSSTCSLRLASPVLEYHLAWNVCHKPFRGWRLAN
jgi:hypothetical protein